MKLMIIIPALNEEEGLQKLLPQIPNEIFGWQVKKIILGDGFGQIQDDDCQFFKGKKGCLGNGFLTQTGFSLALKEDCDCLIKLDGDGQHDPKFIPKILQKLEHGFDFVICSRYHPDSFIFSNPPLDRQLFNRAFRSLINEITGFSLTDALSGYWGIKLELVKQILPQLKTQDYGLGLEILFKIWQLGARVTEIIHPTIYSASKTFGNGSKFARIYSDEFLTQRLSRAVTYFRVIDLALKELGINNLDYQKGECHEIRRIESDGRRLEPKDSVGKLSVSRDSENCTAFAF